MVDAITKARVDLRSNQLLKNSDLLTHGKRVVLSSRIWPSLILSCVFMTTVIVPLSAFVRFISVSRFKALRASRSAGGSLFFGFVISISARSL